MDLNNEFDEELQRHIKIQSDLLKLIKVLDECIENVDSFYCYTLKKQMLAGSTNN